MLKLNRVGLAFVVILCLLSIVSAVIAGGPSGDVSRETGHIGSGVVPVPTYVPDELLVRFKERVSPNAIASVHAGVRAEVVRSFDIVENLQLVRLPQGMRVEAAIVFYAQHPDVLYAEPNYIVEAQRTPSDPQFGELWGLHNTGQAGGTFDADIDAPEAWDLTTGSSSIIVAVIDTGIDYNHPDLSANMFRNTADCNNNLRDDDGNGFTDDCFGIDTFNNDSDPIDDNNHGTHVAGTIGAVGNNSVGVVGVNWNVRLMACKFLDTFGFGTIAGAINCLNYVAIMKDRGFNIIATNNSWGGGPFSSSLFNAIDAHRQRGILFIAAAGNNASNNDVSPFYPASYNVANVIAVAATDRFDQLASFSNYGRNTVHVGAPGVSILSTTPGNTYSVFNGTSMAAPHVTGLAALIKAQDPSRDWTAIKNLILQGGDLLPALVNTITGKRINARGSLPQIQVTPDSLDFGNVAVGGSADQSFTVQNVGGGTLSGNVSTSAPFSIISGSSFSIPSGQSQSVTVRFSPTTTGSFSGSVNFTSNGGNLSRTVRGTSTITLTVTRGGSAGGVVTSNPAGINCGSDCSENYPSGTLVTLTATPGPGATFKEWTGACGGTNPTCTVTMSSALSVTATFSKVFTDPVLVPQSSVVKAVHITDLRSAVDTLRGFRGLGVFPWTDSTLIPGSTVVRREHITELRAALDDAYRVSGRTPPIYTDPTITAGQTVIKAVHVSDVRSAVRALE